MSLRTITNGRLIDGAKIDNLPADTNASLATKNPNIQFKDEGTNVGSSGGVSIVNFTGAGVTASESGGTLTVSIPNTGGTATWGGIAGTLSNQTDLQAALDTKLDDSQLDTDGTLSANSDTKIASQKATKTYADTKLTNSMSTNKLLGRGTAGTGVIEEITLGTNLSLTGNTLNATGGGGSGTVTSVTSANSDISVANTTTTPVLTLNSNTESSASTIAKRDANSNLSANRFIPNATSIVSAGGTTVLTVASSQYQALTGSSSQTYQLPDATTLAVGPCFLFNNNSSSSLIIANAGSTTQYTVPAGGFVECICSSIGTTNGTWDFHPLPPSTVTWSSGVGGLIMNSVLSTTPQISSGASSSTSPSFIPQRGSSTTGFGGDGSNLYGIIGGVAGFTSSATSFTTPKSLGVGTSSPTGAFDVSAVVYNPGTVSVTGTAVTGTSTFFTKTFKVGDSITTTTSSGSETKEINSITSDTAMVTVAAFAGTSTNTAYTSSVTGPLFVMYPSGAIKAMGTVGNSVTNVSDWIYKGDTINITGTQLFSTVRDRTNYNNTTAQTGAINTFAGGPRVNGTGTGSFSNVRGFNSFPTIASTNTGNVSGLVTYLATHVVEAGATGTIANAYGFLMNSTFLSTTNTLSNLYGINIQPVQAGGTLTSYAGIAIAAKPTAATNSTLCLLNTTTIPSGTWGIYNTSTADNYMAGSLGIGSTNLTGYSLRLSKNPTGATTAVGVLAGGIVQSDVTGTYYGYRSELYTQATAFTLSNATHFFADQETIGAGSSVTNQHGFKSASNLIGATNNYAFYADNTAAVTSGKTSYGYYSAVNTASGGGTTYGLYMAGTANNYIAGNLGLGQTVPTAVLHLKAGTATANTAPIKLTTGTALTTPEDGAIEYHSSHLYFTIGSTRYQLDQQAGGGLTNFTEAVSTSAPNATVPVVSLTATNAATNVDVAIVPKGTGAFTLAVANNLSSGGNKRGANAIELQVVRGANTQVASGNGAVIIGSSNTVSGNSSSAIGYQNSVTVDDSFAAGRDNTVTGATSVALGRGNTASGVNSFVISRDSTAQSYGETVLGIWATTGSGTSGSYVSTDRLFVVGNGTGTGARSDALTILKNGNTTIAGTLSIGTSNALTAGSIELGHATDTSISRVSAGVIAVEGVVVPTISSTNTLTNKRVTQRVSTITSSSTPTPNIDTDDMYTVTALAAGATFGAPTGTPTEGQCLILRIKDNGTARTLAFNAIYRASSDLALPTTTVISKTMYLEFVYNSADTKYDFVGFLNNF